VYAGTNVTNWIYTLKMGTVSSSKFIADNMVLRLGRQYLLFEVKLWKEESDTKEDINGLLSKDRNK
jgi:hypothetical protein